MRPVNGKPTIKLEWQYKRYAGILSAFRTFLPVFFLFEEQSHFLFSQLWKHFHMQIKKVYVPTQLNRIPLSRLYCFTRSFQYEYSHQTNL